MKLPSLPLVSVFFALAASLPGCAEPESPPPPGATATTTKLATPLTLDWEGLADPSLRLDLQLGEQASVTDKTLRECLRELRPAFPAWGAATLAWHLLDGGLAEAALLHAALPELSKRAEQAAQAAAARLESGETFFSVLTDYPESEPPAMRQPSPFALGARVAARTASMAQGEWAGPLRTKQGWELIYLEERVPGTRSRTGVALRRIVFPVGEEMDRSQARAAWARLDLSGNDALLRALPRALVRDRIALAR